MKDLNFIDIIPRSEWAALENGTSSFDCSPLMAQALYPDGLPAGQPEPYSAAGSDIVFEAGLRFYFADNIQIKRRVALWGRDGGGANGSENSWLAFAPGKSIVVNSANTLDDQAVAPGYQGAGSTIARLYLTPTGQSSARPAIWLRGRANLEHLRINFFGGHGVYANAGVGSGGATEGSCSQSMLTDVKVTGCAGDAFHFEGKDANAMQVIGCSAINCGGGVNDQSAIGTNTYVGFHAAANGLDYQSIGGANLFTDCYQEDGGAGCNINHPAIVVGGNLKLAPTATATAIIATGASAGPNGALGVRNGIAVIDPASGKRLYVGTNWSNGDLLCFVDPDNFPLGLRLRQVGPDLMCDYADADIARYFKLTGPNTTFTGDGSTPVPYALVADRLFVGSRRI